MSKTRSQWSGKTGFILAAIGSAVGLGNIWRYPYVIYKNGGGAFLIPYLVAIFTAGIPLLILEYTLGHKFRSTNPQVFKNINPKLEWMGWIPGIAAGVIILYYSSILSWALLYAKSALTLEWGQDAEDFFFNKFLNITDNALTLGHIQVPILIGNAIIWFLAWLICYKNVKGIEKANKILLPGLLIIMLLITFQGLNLPGSVDGLNQLFTPQWDQLFNPNVWLEAYGQVFFSLSLAMGIMITFSSYLPDKTDLNNSALLTSFSNFSFEVICAIAIFSILGFMAGQQNVPINDVVSSGVGLSFIVFPAGITSMPDGIATIVAVAFFGGLVVAGITSLISLVEAAAAPCIEKFGFNRTKCITIFYICAFVLSSIFTTGAGLYILDIVDKFVNSYAVIVVGLLQTVIIGWVYGTEKIRNHTNEISHFKIGKWWDICIKYIIPSILTIILVASTISMINEGYEGYSTETLMIYGVAVLVFIVILSIVLTYIKPKKSAVLEMEDK